MNTPEPNGGASHEAGGYEFTPDQNTIVQKTGARAKVWGVMTIAAGTVLLLIGILIGVVALGEGDSMAPLLIYAAFAAVPIYLGLSFFRAGSSLTRVATTSGQDVPNLLNGLNHLASALAIQIGAGILWLLIAVVGIAMMIPSFNHTRERAYLMAMKSDLRHLMSEQETYFSADHNGDGRADSLYTEDLAKLADFGSSQGITNKVMYATRVGYAATSTHAGVPKQSCAVFVGVVPILPTTVDGSKPSTSGVVYCNDE